MKANPYLKTIEQINTLSKVIQLTRSNFKTHQVSLINRIHILTKRKNELITAYENLIGGLDGELTLLQSHFRAGTYPDTAQRTNPSRIQQAQLRSRSEQLRKGISNHATRTARRTASERDHHLTDNDMYKPPLKPLRTLEQERREITNKIINGAHLDAIAMNSLQRALTEKNKAIAEHPDNPLNKPMDKGFDSAQAEERKEASDV